MRSSPLVTNNFDPTRPCFPDPARVEHAKHHDHFLVQRLHHNKREYLDGDLAHTSFQYLKATWHQLDRGYGIIHSIKKSMLQSGKLGLVPLSCRHQFDLSFRLEPHENLHARKRAFTRRFTVAQSAPSELPEL